MISSRPALAAAVVLFSLGLAASASAATDPVAARQSGMKDFGQAMKDGAGYSSGKTPFDAAKVKALMDGVVADAKAMRTLFPASSATAPKTSAKPEVWTNKADFDKRIGELVNLATAASKTTSTETFKPAFIAVSGTCKSCHDTYRKKPS